MERIGIIDAEMLGRGNRHRFPNLACMKISGYHKSKGDEVTLITEYAPVKMNGKDSYFYLTKLYDKIYLSKVFVDTSVPFEILNLDIVIYGGSGFFYADAQPLPYEIEHHMPDYHLYDKWISQKKSEGISDIEFKYYELYSIGFVTRGCVRKCKFCINQHCDKVEKASNINEFFDENRRWICLLDDNFLAYENWKELLDELNATGKQFEFNQGLDIRSLNEEKAQALATSNLYINNIYFAFDNIREKSIITEKLKLWRTHYKKHTHMYILCGFDEYNDYDEDFWAKDIRDTLERIKVCMQYNIFPYIMRYQRYKIAPKPYYGMYVNLASWCNQKGTIVKYSLTEWGNAMQKSDEKIHNRKKLYSVKRYLMEYAGKHPDIAYEYYDLNYNEISEYKYERHTQIRKESPAEIKKHKETFKKIIKIIEAAPPKHKKETEEKVNKNIEEPINEEKESRDIVAFNAKNMNSISVKKSDLLILNCEDEIPNECEKAVMSFSEICLKENSNLYIYSINLKSFTLAKEYIEKNTNLKFKEVTTFEAKENKAMYCSRYSLCDDKNIFNSSNDNNESFNRVSLLKHIVDNTTKENNTILCFFESSSYFKNIGNCYYKRKWMCFKKRGVLANNSAIKSINEILNQHKKDSQQISLIEKDKNIV